MIGYIKGRILEHADGRMLLLIGSESASVGYSVAVPTNPSYLGLLPGETAELFVYTHVREDILDLFGFATRGEKELFLTLLSVNGIGPKVALGILSGAEAPVVIQAILEGDKEFLRNLPGIGKKTAERVVLELVDTIRKKMELGAFGPIAQTGGKRNPLADLARAGGNLRGENQLVHDAKTALMGLGYREPEAAQMVARAFEDFDLEQPAPRVEDLIRSALQQSL